MSQRKLTQSRFAFVRQRLVDSLGILKRKGRALYKALTSIILRYPLRSFFSVLSIMTLLTIIGSFLSHPPSIKTVETPPKTITLFGIGKAPRMQVSAQVQKSGVVHIVAQSPGVVQAIYKTEGQTVGRGTNLLWLSTNYQGGTIPSVSRKMAEHSAALAVGTFTGQREMIAKRREIAGKLDTQTDDLRNITHQSVEETKTQITLNEEILSSLSSQIDYLVATNVGGANDSLILTTKQGKAGILAGLSALKAGLRNSEYQENEGNAPARLSNSTREVTRMQLDLEEKSLALSTEVALLNLKIAQISESLMFPASPVAGRVERIHVTVGQNVNPGTILATVTGTKTTTTLAVSLPGATARQLSYTEKSVGYLPGGKTVELTPRYISQEPTDGTLHTILFTLPSEYDGLLGNGANIAIELPIGSAQTTSSVPYVPLDAVYQTQQASYVYIATPSAQGAWIAKSTPIELGSVYGSFVEVRRGLASVDQVILTRNVVDGDPIALPKPSQ